MLNVSLDAMMMMVMSMEYLNCGHQWGILFIPQVM
jgi:hypothetical protein